jgi:acetyl-CoA carboxylase carboxyl transferase subunit alpha
VPLVAAIIGEGGSGGAVALAAGNAVLMLEHAIYSVISPEGCTAILWRDGSHAEAAAEVRRLTAQDLLHLEIIDAIVPEPVGGAHRRTQAAIDALGAAIEAALAPLRAVDRTRLREERRQKYLAIGRHGL